MTVHAKPRVIRLSPLFFLFFCASLFSLTRADLHAQPLETLNVITGEWPPYSSQRLSGQGLITEITTAVLNDMGYSPNYAFLPFYLGYDLVKNGDIIGSFPYYKRPQRESEVHFSEPLMATRSVIFYKPARLGQLAEVKSVRDLREYRIGFVKGYSYGEEIDTTFASARTFQSELHAFKMLQNGSIDLLPAGERVGREILKRYFYNTEHEFATVPGVSRIDSVYFIASKRGDEGGEFVERFNVSLRRIKDQGVYDEIVDRFERGQKKQQLVRLTTSDSFPLVLGREAPDDEDVYVIPKGTRAIVLEWSERFLSKGKVNMYDQMFVKSKVRLIEGPLKGRVFYVDNMYIEIE